MDSNFNKPDKMIILRLYRKEWRILKMLEKEMRLELEDNDVNDNPFDVMLHHSLEMTRELLFACCRLKNSEIPEGICINLETLKKRMDIITKEFNKLLNMSKETVAMCRETSYYYQQKEFNKINDSLLRFEKNMETVWSRCVPNRNDRFEKIKLGEESNEYKRILELREIIDKSEELSCVDKKHLCSLCDVINRPNECIKYWMSENEFEKKNEIVKKYNLTEEDVNYMIAYKFHS